MFAKADHQDFVVLAVCNKQKKEQTMQHQHQANKQPKKAVFKIFSDLNPTSTAKFRRYNIEVKFSTI